LSDTEHLRAKLFQNLARRPNLCFQQSFSNHAVKPPQIAGYRSAHIRIQRAMEVPDHRRRVVQLVREVLDLPMRDGVDRPR
jgi:hypothetical protein